MVGGGGIDWAFGDTWQLKSQRERGRGREGEGDRERETGRGRQGEGEGEGFLNSYNVNIGEISVIPKIL